MYINEKVEIPETCRDSRHWENIIIFGACITCNRKLSQKAEAEDDPDFRQEDNEDLGAAYERETETENYDKPEYHI